MRRPPMHCLAAALLLAAAPGLAQVPPTPPPPTPAPLGKLTVVVVGKVTQYEDETPIPAGTVVMIRLYGGKKGEAKVLRDAAPTADRLVFHRPDSADLTNTHCYEARAWIDSNANAQVDTDEESIPTAEACGKFVVPVIKPPLPRKPAPPTSVTVESPL